VSRPEPAGTAPPAPVRFGGLVVAGAGNTAEPRKELKRMLIWLLVLLLVILAIGGGVALSKFLFLILVIALILALFGIFNRSTV
jgi:hypothetical protein